jgi:seryl-tRNA synthetase
MIKNVLDIDLKKREIQAELEKIQAESNAIAKEVGTLMKAGKKEEAEKLIREFLNK